jgi:hypothetical protein
VASSNFARARAFIQKHEHAFSIGSFLVGFTIDNIALKRIDLLFSNLLLYTYLGIVIITMAILHYRARHKPSSDWRKRALEWIPFVSQFAFGGMFSGFLIFYSQSGSLVASWPFVLLIFALLATNEFMRKYHERLTFQSLLLFFCFFSFAIYTLPILIGEMGDWVFELSGLAAIILFALFLGFLTLIDKKRVTESLKNIVLGAVAIYLLITTLYFSNVLPPIPLALKDIGIYHSIVRDGADYIVTEDPQPWYSRLTGVTVTVNGGEALYAFSSIFAPTRISTNVVHEWQYYDEAKNNWVTAASIPFPINGGRDGGYRGYTAKGLLTPGKWRVNVKTTRGQLIGREAFKVVQGTPATVTRILK